MAPKGMSRKRKSVQADLREFEVLLIASGSDSVGRRNVLRRLLDGRGANTWTELSAVPESVHNRLVVVIPADDGMDCLPHCIEDKVAGIVNQEWVSEVLLQGRWVDTAGYSVRKAQVSSADFSSPDITDLPSAKPDYRQLVRRIDPSTLVPRTLKVPKRERFGPIEPCENTSSLEQRKSFAARLSKYACQRATTMNVCSNEHLCQMLVSIGDLRSLQDTSSTTEFRSKMYYFAAAALRTYCYRLESLEEAQLIPHCGDKILGVIDEYLKTGWVEELERLSKSEDLQAIWALQGVHGIGLRTAHRLVYARGVRTLAQLHALFTETHHKEVITLSHYNALNHEKLTRDQADILAQKIRDAGQLVDPLMEYKVVGGFRRGKLEGHDLDIVCWHRRDEYGHLGKIEKIVSKLDEWGLVEETLLLDTSSQTMERANIGERDTALGHDMWFGIMRDPLKRCGVKRVDIVGSRRSENAFCTLAWSGTKNFQRSLREYCQREKLWRFDSHGLWIAQNGPDGSHIRPDKLGVVSCEEDIFRALDLEYRTPNERCC